jgi:hypothetical protein
MILEIGLLPIEDLGIMILILPEQKKRIDNISMIILEMNQENTLMESLIMH